MQVTNWQESRRLARAIYSQLQSMSHFPSEYAILLLVLGCTRVYILKKWIISLWLEVRGEKV